MVSGTLFEKVRHKAAEEHIQDVRSSHPIYQEFYEKGERHILDLVKLHLKELEEKK